MAEYSKKRRVTRRHATGKSQVRQRERPGRAERMGPLTREE